MRWSDIQLTGKFTIGFGLVLLILIVVALRAFMGIENITGNAEEVIDGNMLRTDMEHKYVQHLNWAQELSNLLINPEHIELNIQTDPHKCNFGLWYYGEGRKHAEHLAPELKPLFDKFEAPHKLLHESAVKIDDAFEAASWQFPANMRDAKITNLNWLQQAADELHVKNSQTLSVNSDPNKCDVGKWLHSEEIENLILEFPEIMLKIEQVRTIHDNLHIEIKTVNKQLVNDPQTAKNTFETKVKQQASELQSQINDLLTWYNIPLSGMQEANKIYLTQTLPQLQTLSNLFSEVVRQSEKYIMTDTAMLQEARNTSTLVAIFSAFAIIIGLVLAIIIGRGIINPIKKGVWFASEVARGNLTASVDIHQQDEIGKLAEALTGMVDKLKLIVNNIKSGAKNIEEASRQMSSTSQSISQGASEQASAAEEVSSSMEEMVTNIQQNTQNAQSTEKIALQASGGIESCNTMAKNSVEAMKAITEKITVINDIAFQTNILALNAAVEAARAGEHGKGFAVVAAEVRRLAENSKTASDEIQRVSQEGLTLTNSSGNKLFDIVPEIQKTARLVQEIAASSAEQQSGADQVNNALQQLNLVTQQNAASSEELATSAEQLASQAEQLSDIISFFKTNNEGHTPTPTTNQNNLTEDSSVQSDPSNDSSANTPISESAPANGADYALFERY